MVEKERIHSYSFQNYGPYKSKMLVSSLTLHNQYYNFGGIKFRIRIKQAYWYPFNGLFLKLLGSSSKKAYNSGDSGRNALRDA